MTKTLKDYAEQNKNLKQTTPSTEAHYNQAGDVVTLRMLWETYLQTGRATVIHGNGDGTVSVSLQEGLE